MLRILKGNLFNSDCQTLVNTVNCNGVMGAGIALEFRLRHPDMFRRYVDRCANGKMDIGKLWLYKPNSGKESKWILNFPTKMHWKHPSRVSYLHKGLKEFVDTYEGRGITSVAFPVLGARNGKIPESQAIGIMESHLHSCEIDVEIYRYDPEGSDDLFGQLKERFKTELDGEIAKAARLRLDRVRAIRDAMGREEVRSIAQLGARKGIGVKTLESVFRYVTTGMAKDTTTAQKQLEF